LPVEKHVNTRNSLFSECGLTWTHGNQYYREILSRIVGGRQVVPYSHPWQVLLNNRGQYCGGKRLLLLLSFVWFFSLLNKTFSLDILASILSTKWLVTAAHCVNG